MSSTISQDENSAAPFSVQRMASKALRVAAGMHDGLTAMRDYERLRSRNVPHALAAARALCVNSAI